MTSMASIVAVAHPAFARVLDMDGHLRVLFEGTTWAEGPAFDPRTGALYFSDVPDNVLYRYSTAGTEVVRRPSGFANGNTIDAGGSLITCEQGERRLTRTAPDGSRATVVDRYRGRRLNSPNDVVVHSDGSIWFTDPDYGIRSEDQGGIALRELDGCYVFRYSPTDDVLEIVADDLVMPNGLAFAPDERTLYVADSAYTHDPEGPRHVRAYDVYPPAALSRSRVHVEIDAGWPDGLRVDEAGRLWCAAGDGARCYAPDGRRLGTVMLPEAAANLCFAIIGARPVLVVTASTRVYAVPLAAT